MEGILADGLVPFAKEFLCLSVFFCTRTVQVEQELQNAAGKALQPEAFLKEPYYNGSQQDACEFFCRFLIARDMLALLLLFLVIPTCLSQILLCQAPPRAKHGNPRHRQKQSSLQRLCSSQKHAFAALPANRNPSCTCVSTQLRRGHRARVGRTSCQMPCFAVNPPPCQNPHKGTKMSFGTDLSPQKAAAGTTTACGTRQSVLLWIIFKSDGLLRTYSTS
eukprot:3194166-Amphidinium_carterae.1